MMPDRRFPVRNTIIKFYVDAGLRKEDAEMLFNYISSNLPQFRKLVAEWPQAGGQTQGAGSTHT